MKWSKRVAAGCGAVVLLAGGLPGYAGDRHTNVVSQNPVDWTPDVEDGKVHATATVGGTTVTVGDFSSVRQRGATTSLARNNIFAFDSSGRVSTTFVPQLNGTQIFDVVPAGDGQSVYVGGVFTRVNGVVRSRVARINVNTGALVTSFRGPSINRAVNSLHLANGKLYVGGRFDLVGGRPQTSLVALDPATGANTDTLDLTFSETWNGGVVGIDEFTMSPDGSELIAIGNFRKVEGQDRAQIVMIDTAGPTATLDTWATDRFSFNCHPGFDTYMWGVDYAPDGSYFVVVTTGAFSGGVNSGTLCDTASRWEAGLSGAGQQPTWVDYMGGDTLTEVEVTDHAVYIGGHFRWANNPYVGDAVGPGAVRRMGIAALDTRNGLPLSWNPGRQRGWGVWGFESTPQGLWVGHDTDVIGGETRRRLALMPLVGGASLPADDTGSLPGEAYLLGKRPASTGPSPVLHRINAGGPELASTDGYMGWAGDEAAAPSPLHNSGSNAGAWSGPVARSADVPASTPQEVFTTERWDPGEEPEMQWDLPADAGLPLEVRLYFSNGYDGTSAAGSRVFDVKIDGEPVLVDYDIAAGAGHRTGTMKSFKVTSDGNVDIDFGHVVENPLVNGIEVVRTDLPMAEVPVLYRVNAGGPELASADSYMNWSGDEATQPSPMHNNRSNTAGWAVPIGRSAGVPAGTPQEIFSTERWDGGEAPEMEWDFPVQAGLPLQVRLYMSNGYDGTAAPGSRVFDVNLDGTTVLDDYDIAADAGHQVGTMKSFDITSDGNVDIDFGHVVENPLVNGIEIVRSDIPPPVDEDDDRVVRTSLGESGATGSTEIADGGVDWSSARGAFMVDGRLYTGWADGTFTWRAFNGSTFGAPRVVDLHGLTAFAAELPGVRGMWFDGETGRMYFTLNGQSDLFYRYFTPESLTVGAVRFRVPDAGAGIDWRKVSGGFLANGRLYFRSSDGSLQSAQWQDGGPVPGTARTVSGPAVDGVDWNSRALFLYAD